jgi:hypothetical protein
LFGMIPGQCAGSERWAARRRLDLALGDAVGDRRLCS